MEGRSIRPLRGPAGRRKGQDWWSRRAAGLVIALASGACASTVGSSRVDRLGLTQPHAAYVNEQLPGRVEAEEPVLMVLGASWLEQDLRLSDRSVVFVDLPGRGKAAALRPRDVESARLEDDLASLDALRTRLELDRVVLMGWSYHGGLALRYALKHPQHVAGLVLVAPLPPRRAPYWEDFLGRMRLRTDPKALANLEAIRRADAKRRQPVDFCRAFTRLFVQSRSVDPAAALARMRSEPCVLPNIDPELSGSLGRAIIDGLGFWDWRSDLPGLDLPVLIVHGSEDAYPLQGSKEYAGAIPGARLLIIEDTGHLPWLEQPDEFDAALQRFLDSFQPEPSTKREPEQVDTASGPVSD